MTITVSTPEGVQAHRAELTLEQAKSPITLRVKGLPQLEITPSGDPTQGALVALTGRVVDEKGTAVPAGLPVVLWGAAAGDGAAQPLVVAQTQSIPDAAPDGDGKAVVAPAPVENQWCPTPGF